MKTFAPKAMGCLFFLIGITVTVPCIAETSTEMLTESVIMNRVKAALDRSTEYLASRQAPDGSWVAGNNACNGLALLAFMGHGHTPGHGPYRDVLERGKKYLLASQVQTGPHVGYLGGSMYMHALATLALAEMYGMDPDPKLEEAVRKAVDLIVRAQSPSGGWRYAPNPGDQDLSVTIMQVVALRAANNAEVPVPAKTIEKATAYVRACSNPGGGFGYAGPGHTPMMTAAGILALQLLGQYNDERITKSLDVMATIPIRWDASGPSYFYYFHYYAIQGQYQAGGKHWNNWHPRIRELLLSKQNKDGSWDAPPGTAEAGVDGAKIYTTSMASLVLEIYMHFLPAYQR